MRWFQASVARARQHPRVLAAVVIALTLVVLHGRTLVGHIDLSRDPWRFSDDARVLIHPQFRWEDPRVFPRDPPVEYFLASLPEGYRLVYRAFGPLIGVRALSKTLPCVLLALGLAALGWITGRLAGAFALLASLSLALGSAYVLGRMVGGLPRGFAFPLLAFGAVCLFEGRARALAACAVLAAGFYPAAGLTLGCTLALLLLLPAKDRGCTRDWSWKRRAALLAVTGVAAALVVLPTALRLAPWGPAIGPHEVAAFPEAGPGGRFEQADRAPFPPLPEAALGPLEAALVGAGDAPLAPLSLRAEGRLLAPLFVLFGLGGWAVLARRRSDARRLLLLPLALVLCHTLARAVEPRLFLPERYVAYGVPLVALLAAPTALGALRGAKRAWVRALPIVYAVALLVVLGGQGAPYTGLTVNVPPDDRPLFRALAKLPLNVVIATVPTEMSDCIPYVTRRSVFLARETHMPFHSGYTLLERARARALFAAYFAPTDDELRRFRNEWGVTHLLLDLTHFSAPPPYFNPFGEDIARAFERGRDAGFAAPKLRERAAVFELGRFALLDLARL